MFKNRAIKYFKELVRLKTSPKEIAAGAALGVFIGFLPIWGLLQLLVALFLIATFKINKIAIILGTFITTPLTIPFIYTMSFRMGKWMLKSEVQILSLKEFSVAKIVAIAKPLLIGSVTLGLIAAIVTYIVTYYVVSAVHKKRKKTTPPTEP